MNCPTCNRPMPKPSGLALPKPVRKDRFSHRIDREATAKRGFTDPRSFVHQNGHIFVYGMADHEMMRAEIFERAGGVISRYADGRIWRIVGANCQLCPISHPVGWFEGEWHHAQKTYGGRRCDGPCCGKFGCRAGHERLAGRRIGGRKANG